VEEKEIHDELASIRSLMERSSKFISLSGLSGILAGVYALVGAIAAYIIIQGNPTIVSDRASFSETLGNTLIIISSLFAIAITVLVCSIATAIILSKRQAKRKGQPFWGKISQTLLFHMTIPLITGGLLIILFIFQNNGMYTVPTMLIFYGLSLVSASNFTFTDVKYLGLLEIALGLIAACFPGYGLLFWAVGFGVLHIIYGGMMYLKYDR
jgi:flagellar biosynthesis component FlhA